MPEPEPLSSDAMTIEAQPLEATAVSEPAMREGASSPDIGGTPQGEWDMPKQPAKRIRCKSCSTIFNFDETKPVQTCPNCGKSGTATKSP
jgi:hypothetical protein